MSNERHLAMAVVVRDGKVLVQQRFRRGKGMVIEFPGGSVDEGESGEQAAIRELREETGLESVSKLAVEIGKNEFGGDIFYVVLSEDTHNEPIATDPERQQTFFWMEPKNLPLNDFFPSDIQFIQQTLTKYLD
ncbi:MutT/nudix family protein [Vibrio nigripulchritudo ATCC 27043]|uniref:NUDIX hydrolase n=1 Tax=Vibrio nigripulchritudo TaxID=28173 RepID=UPI00021C14E3|nr:NUDIX hydrolase [Vibrio nigripulchritudo]EGU57546.1 MutT/nudix family protein [Vibrio nigripulchritudo ATCC 27043]